MKRKLYLSTLMLCFVSTTILAQKKYRGIMYSAFLNNAKSILYNPSDSSLKFVLFGDNHMINENELNSWVASFENQCTPFNHYVFNKKNTDKLGFTTVDFNEFVDNHRVEYGIMKFQIKNGVAFAMNGEMHNPDKELHFVQKISDNSVLGYAKQKVASDKIVANDINYNILEKLWFVAEGRYFPTMKLEVSSFEKVPYKKLLYYSLETGKLLFEEDKIEYTNSNGVANTLYCGNNRSIITDSINNTTYYLRENGTRQIETKNLNGSTSSTSSVQFVDNDNIWNSNVGGNMAANDAHLGAEKTWQFYLSKFGRNSYDNLGSYIRNYVHYSSSFVNAFWDGTAMYYGDGDGVSYTPLTSTDIVGHEITHAVTQYTANLVYNYESGALNESFSDIFGVSIDYYTNPTTANFLEGDQVSISNTPFRNMQNPNATLQPDTYGGTYWYVGSDDNGGVHTNSQVQNFWFYLLCSGGSGINDISNTYNVQAIGMNDATAIVYRTLTNYLTSNSQYSDARTYSIQSAIDLFGQCSNQVIQVTNAWYAVGIGSQYNNSVVAAFYSPDTIVCGTGSPVHFTNVSTNAASNIWDFGDGTTSNLTNPTKYYSTLGNYSVKLKINGVSSCNSSDSALKTNYIHVVNNSTPVATLCSPISSSPSSIYGLSNVVFKSIINNSGSSILGYENFSCTKQTTVHKGSQYLLQATTFGSESVKAWLDLNNDGVLATSEIVANNPSTMNFHQSVIQIPTTGVVIDTPLRFRIISSSSSSSTPCNIGTYGQCEDYTVRITNAQSSPIANFMVNDTIVSVGSSVTFTDLSFNGPQSWSWTINGGSPSSSTLQNPISVYNTAGNYVVKLVVSNTYGSDSITKTIHVISSFNMCSGGLNQTTSATSGVLYDSGGPIGNYGNNENCTFAIHLSCTDSIFLNISSFSTESGADYLQIGSSSGIIGAYSGSSIPSTIKIASDSVYFYWQTDGSVVYSGFSINWTSHQLSSNPPVANFSANTYNPALLDTVSFTNLCSTNTYFWNWSFGDGTYSTLTNPKHAYSTPGNYTIKLIAGSCSTIHDTITHSLTVQASPHVVISPLIYGTYSVGCDDTITLPLYIQNTAGGILNWYQPQVTSSNGNLVWYYGADISSTGEYWNTMNAIKQITPGFTYDSTNTTSPTVLQNKLVGKKLLLIPEDENGSSTVVSLFSTVVQNFVNNGGTVVICGDLYGLSYSSLGLFTSSTINNGTGGNSNKINNTTPLTNNLPNSTMYLQNGAYLPAFTNSDVVNVYTYNSTYSHVAYRNVGSGRVIYIGNDFYQYATEQAILLSNAVGWTVNNNTYNNIQLIPSSGSLPAGSTDTAHINVTSSNLPSGLDTLTAIIHTNDITNLLDTIKVIVNVTNLPCANFSSDTLGSCSGAIHFTDQTTHSPTSWTWNFGDGGTSNSQSPYHVYSLPGIYNVKLIVANSYGQDTVIKQINVLQTGGPIPTTCNNPTSYTCCGYGITNISFGSINNSSNDATEGYRDFTCTYKTNLPKGSYVPLYVASTATSQYLSVFIDTNNNGTFSSNEAFINNIYVSGLNYIGGFYTPNNILLNVPLRMRVILSNGSSFPCNAISYGQAEDYTVKFIIPTTPPIANFLVSDTIVGVGNNVIFNDLSLNAPQSWSWTIIGGSPSSSSLQNPTCVFNAVGNYIVKLVVSNSYGSDSITKTIHVTNSFNMCAGGSNQTTSATSGALYDSGGPIGNYGNNENCSFVIHPPCTDSIFLNFSSFSTESGADYLQISSSSGIIGAYSGGSIPSTIKIASDSVYFYWHTDGSVVYSGFSITWSSHQLSSNPPVANFSANTYNPALLDTVSFTNLCSANTYFWNWSFGDGTYSTLANPIHVYSTPGNYTVKLIAGSCSTIHDTITHALTIQASPVSTISPKLFGPYSIGCHDSLNLTSYIHNINGGTLNWYQQPSFSNGGNLVWYYGADTSSTGEYWNTMNAIKQITPGFTYDSTNTTSPTVLQNKLVGKKLLLIPEDENGSLSVVSQFSTVVQNYVNNGGTVVLCGDYNVYSFSSLGLFTYSSIYSTYGSNSDKINNTTPLTNNLPNSTMYLQNGAYLPVITNSDVVNVYTYNSTYSHVAYRNVGSGRVIYIGNDFYQYATEQAILLSNAVGWTVNNNTYNNIQLIPSSGSLPAGSTDTAHINVTSSNLPSGLDTLTAIIHTNDITNLLDTIKVIVNVTNLPCANFSSDTLGGCSGAIHFTDKTTHSPTSWLWKFGDGTTSNTQNTLHYYSSPGTYNVTLIVANGVGTDSLTRIVTIVGALGPIPTTCIAQTTANCCNNGLTHFLLGTINSSSSTDVEGYLDRSCSYKTDLEIEKYATFTINAATTSQYYSIFIDTNNDGIFTIDETFINNHFFSTLSITDSFYVPASVPLHTPLRLRVIVGAYYVYNPCAGINYGQAEDYTVIFIEPKPIANFVGNPLTAYVSQPIQLTDLSTNNPTSWQWTLSGASPSSSSIQNPVISYNQPGDYDVQLKVINAAGNDTKTKAAYLHILPLPSLDYSENYDYCISRRYFVPQIDTPYNSVFWSFGDGYDTTGSKNQIVTHTYPDAGNYLVKMAAISDFRTDTLKKTITMGPWPTSISYQGNFQTGNPISFYLINKLPYFTETIWSFGDGNNSLLDSPIHYFVHEGQYPLLVHLHDQNSCSINLYDTLAISNQIIPDSSIKVYPSPFNSQLTISFNQPMQIKHLKMIIYNSLGQVVYEKTEDDIQVNKSIIIETNLASGIYQFYLKADDLEVKKKIMKK